MFGRGTFTDNYSTSSEENIQVIESEDDIGLSRDYLNKQKEENNKRKQLKNFIRSQHMASENVVDGGFLDLISRGQNLTNQTNSWSEQESEEVSQNEDYGDFLMGKYSNGPLNNFQRNGFLNKNKVNKVKNLQSPIPSSLSSFTFTTDSQLIGRKKINDFGGESCSLSSIGLNENLNERRRNWDEEGNDSESLATNINLNNLSKNENSINTLFNLKSQLSSSSLNNGHSTTLNSSILNIPRLNSADSCSTLIQEIPTDCLQRITDPFLLYNERNNLFNLAQKIGVKFEVREIEGAFIFSHPLTKNIIVFNSQIFNGQNGQKIEGIRISLHKNERLYRESHLWPVERWLGLATIEGVCRRFFSPSCDI
ncbi:unnamed protein product [Meloidogyne enterolobii]|uniref:Uncharacterized protein n=2 Tax=Meloidogyne enterolobii TaxID=390850 RepID=A0ACB0YYG3_MELEN